MLINKIKKILTRFQYIKNLKINLKMKKTIYAHFIAGMQFMYDLYLIPSHDVVKYWKRQKFKTIIKRDKMCNLLLLPSESQVYNKL